MTARTIMMDNFHFDTVCKDEHLFELTLNLAIKCSGHHNITHYQIKKVKGGRDALAFYWTDGANGSIILPYKMDVHGVIEFARNWLKTAEYGEQPDHDGSNSKGWRIYNEQWGHVWGAFQGIIAIETAWAMHGK